MGCIGSKDQAKKLKKRGKKGKNKAKKTITPKRKSVF